MPRPTVLVNRPLGFVPVSGVYALLDPRTDRVMYAGQSLDIDYRFRQHLSLRGGKHRKKYEWVCQLRAEGLIPKLVVVAQCIGEEMTRIERETIRHYQGIGQCELNQASYGLGGRSVVKTGSSSRDDWFQLSRQVMAVASQLSEIADEIGRLSGPGPRSRIYGIRSKVLGVAFGLGEAIKSKFGSDADLLRVLDQQD